MEPFSKQKNSIGVLSLVGTSREEHLAELRAQWVAGHRFRTVLAFIGLIVVASRCTLFMALESADGDIIQPRETK